MGNFSSLAAMELWKEEPVMPPHRHVSWPPTDMCHVPLGVRPGPGRVWAGLTSRGAGPGRVWAGFRTMSMRGVGPGW